MGCGICCRIGLRKVVRAQKEKARRDAGLEGSRVQAYFFTTFLLTLLPVTSLYFST
ncbi:hypothetical protein FHX61_000281 [Cupriavidus alkaliphilus]|uniref:Uncharacterized protein n=1 Tax=Cupriavidus alkaliphilus TaxID=942866 RepID=A0A7W4V745_9BURK|nr:hypothetical protein [Cupriavidus alkaliphilus]